MSACRGSMRRALVAVSTTLFFLQAPTEAQVALAKSFEDFYREGNGSALVVCEAIRNYGVVGGSDLLFSCGVLRTPISGVLWRVEPEHSCKTTELYRVTEFEPARENTDVQLLLSSSKPVRGVVHAVVVAASGAALLESAMDFVIAARNDTPPLCHCKRNGTMCSTNDSCVCTGERMHYDRVHGVCFSSVPMGKECLYHHQCQSSDTTLECLKGRCDCGYGTTSDPAGGGCLQVARYGERCSNRTACIVGRCGRDGRCTCDEGQLRKRGTCVDPPPPPSQPEHRSLLGADHSFLQLPFVVVCVVLLAAACVARTTSGAAAWLLWRRHHRRSSCEHRSAAREAAREQQQTLTLFPSRLGDRLGLQRRRTSVAAAL